MNVSNNSFRIKGEPAKGIIFKDEEEGITLTYDPNMQIIYFWDDEDMLYDHLDCFYFKEWKNVLHELKMEYGINISCAVISHT